MRTSILGIWLALLLGVLAGACGAQPSAPPGRDALSAPGNSWRAKGDVIGTDNAAQVQSLGSLPGHNSAVRHFCFSRSGRFLFTSDTANVTILWDMDTGRQVAKFDQTINGFFGPEDATYVVVGVDKTLRFFNLENGQMLGTVPTNTDSLLVAEVSPDGKMLATGGAKGDLWDVANRNLIRTFAGVAGNIRTLAFSPDSKTLAAIVNKSEKEGGPTVLVWRVPSGEQIASLGGFVNGIQPEHLMFAPDGKWLAVASHAQVRMYETTTYTQSFALVGDDLAAERAVAFSPDSALFATVGSTDLVYVWSMKDNGKIIAKLPRHDRGASDLTFSPNNELLLTTSALPKTGAFLWHNQSFKPGVTEYPRNTVGQEANGIQKAAWAPDGRMFVLAESSGGVLVWGIPKPGS